MSILHCMTLQICVYRLWDELERVSEWAGCKCVYQVKNKVAVFLLLTVSHLFWYVRKSPIGGLCGRGLKFWTSKNVRRTLAVLLYKNVAGRNCRERSEREWERKNGRGGMGEGMGGGVGGDWVSSDCVSGQLHMFLIKVLTLWDQLHTGMLVFVIRPNVLWSGGSPKNRASSGPSPQLSPPKPMKKTNLHTVSAQCGHSAFIHQLCLWQWDSAFCFQIKSDK